MNQDVRIGYFTAQPSSIDPFHGFDPDSYTAITACHDSLTRIGGEGELLPALAKEWRRIDPVTVEFSLREDVKFHNGEKLNSDAVVATIAAQRDPANKSPTGQGILGSIKRAEKIDEYRFRIHTEFPDGMLLWRLAMFSDIVPPKALEKNGVGGFKNHPIGTGPFVFDAMEPGKYIRYVRNPDYWGGAPQVASFRFVIMPAPSWVEALVENKIDLVYGMHSVQAPLLDRRQNIFLKSRLVALSHWFLLSENGPLADKRVRLAMNYAIDNYMLAKIQGQENSIPQRCIGTSGQYGYNADTMVFPFDADKARDLLTQAGFGDGFTLKGIVADHSVSLVQMVAAYLADVKIKLEYDVVPRPVWMDRIPNARMSGAGRYEGDFAVAPVDNPIMYSGFHHYIFLFSQGPFSLLNNADYDKRFLDTMTSTDDGEEKLKQLDQYAHDEGLALFTVQSSVLVAAREGVDLQISKNGHFDNFSWLSLKDSRPSESRPEWEDDYLDLQAPIAAEEFRKVLEATQYSSDLFYFPAQNLSDRRLEKIVTNLNYQQQVKQLQDKIRFEQIVQYLNKTRDMEGILNASRFSGITNYNMAGEMVLCNPAFIELMGKESRTRPLSQMFPDAHEWEKFLATLNSEGGLFGSMNFLRSDGDILEAQAACSLRKGSAGENIGYLLIIRDESEERKLRRDLERSYRELEDKVVQRTSELSKTLDEVQRLKHMQDGDYFLTTLLLQPLGLNSVEPGKFSIETFSRQKKCFSFKQREYEIGGDLNIACTLTLRGCKYTLVLNADAMGKSIQGAGGVLVLGSIMRAIIERSRISPVEREFTPERWLKSAVSEIQLVFESFNGSMYVSAIMGLLDEKSGCFFYINTEHPAPVILRQGKARFIEQGTTHRKIGTPGLAGQLRVRIFPLEPGDLIFLGSDGKDDILIGEEGTVKKVNEDESLFLNILAQAQGDLKQTVNLIDLAGEIMDDLSIIRIGYHPGEAFSHNQREATKQASRKKIQSLNPSEQLPKIMEKLESHISDFPEDSQAIGALARAFRKNGSYSEAIDCAERLRLRDKVDLKNLQLLVDLYAYTGNLGRAMHIIEECRQIDKNDDRTQRLQDLVERKLQMGK